jgi:hypothetical protein
VLVLGTAAQWAPWTGWTDCPGTCGGLEGPGVLREERIRDRRCSGPEPCPGAAVGSREQEREECPCGQEATSAPEGSGQEGEPLQFCRSGPCQHGATCLENHVEYVCSCPPGYQGDLCQLEVDECAAAPCQNGGTCEDQVRPGGAPAIYC